MARVTVVIPAYNPGPFLDVAVRSVVGQTFQDWEAVVVDDGSTEDISHVSSLDGRVRIIRQDNRGLSAARNAALTASDSEFVAFLDSDDVWLPTKLARQLNVLTASDAALCSTDFERIDENDSRIGGGFRGCRADYLDLLTGNGICVSTVMVRRDVMNEIGMFDRRFAQAQDWHLWLRIARDHSLVHVDEVLVQYRIHGSNMSRNYRRYLAESQRILFEHRGAGTEAATAVSSGWKLVRTVAGAQAFDAFRLTRNPRHLVFSLRFAPLLTLRQLRRFALRR